MMGHRRNRSAGVSQQRLFNVGGFYGETEKVDGNELGEFWKSGQHVQSPETGRCLDGGKRMRREAAGEVRGIEKTRRARPCILGEGLKVS